MSCLGNCSKNNKRRKSKKRPHSLNEASCVRETTKNPIRLSDQEIGSLMDKFQIFSISHPTEKEEVQYEAQFR